MSNFTMNNNRKPAGFVLPKIQRTQKNDLISILSSQPKSVSELDQFRVGNDLHLNNNNEFVKNYMTGLLELMKNQLAEFGSVVIEMRKCMHEKQSSEEFFSKSEAMMINCDNNFKTVFERMDKFEKVLNNLVINQENFYEKFEKKFVELFSQVENKASESRNVLETSTDNLIEILKKKVTTQQNLILYDKITNTTADNDQTVDKKHVKKSTNRRRTRMNTTSFVKANNNSICNPKRQVNNNPKRKRNETQQKNSDFEMSQSEHKRKKLANNSNNHNNKLLIQPNSHMPKIQIVKKPTVNSKKLSIYNSIDDDNQSNNDDEDSEDDLFFIFK